MDLNSIQRFAILNIGNFDYNNMKSYREINAGIGAIGTVRALASMYVPPIWLWTMAPPFFQSN